MRENRRQINQNRLKNIILEFIKENIKTYLILTIIFFIGLTLGVIFVNNANETQANQISGYINNFINSIINVGTVSVVAKGALSAIKAIPGINIAVSALNILL